MTTKQFDPNIAKEVLSQCVTGKPDTPLDECLEQLSWRLAGFKQAVWDEQAAGRAISWVEQTLDCTRSLDTDSEKAYFFMGKIWWITANLKGAFAYSTRDRDAFFKAGPDGHCPWELPRLFGHIGDVYFDWELFDVDINTAARKRGATLWGTRTER